MTGYKFTAELRDGLRHSYLRRSNCLTWQGKLKLSNLLDRQEYLRELVDSKVSNITNRPQYQETYDAYLDFTQSCDYTEAKSWVRYIILEALAYSLVPMQGEETDWVYLFSAAYDLYKHFEE